jgi:glycosyltransferase involved in cell wall biosynthesis
LHLAHTIQHYWPFIAGGENYCQAISEGLATENEVTVYTTDLISTSPPAFSTNMFELKTGVRIIRVPSLRLLSGLYGRKKLENGSSSVFRAASSMDTHLTWPQALLARAFSSSIPHMFFWLTECFKNADVIVAFNMITGMTSLSYLASRVEKKPFVVFPFYHVGLSSFEKPSLFKILRDASLVICSTDYEKEELINRGLRPRKLYVVNEGVKIPLVEAEAVKNLEKILDRREDQLLLMYVGRRDYDKGYPHVLSAVAKLVRSGLPVKLIITGYGETGAERADYFFLRRHGAILDLGIADEQTKNAAISLSDAIVLPSRAETYPLVFIESWLLGKPVVGARIGSVSSIVKEGINGLLVEFGDVSELVVKLRFLYERPDKRIEIGKVAKTWANRNLTLEKTIASVKRILNELVEGKQIGH